MTGTRRVWLLNGGLLLAGVIAYVAGVRNLSAPNAPFEIPWWVLAGVFCVAEIFVVHVEFRRDAHSVSLSEIPLVLGLFFSDPKALVLAQIVGAGAALVLHRRQSLLKLTFNLGHFFVEACVAVLIFRSIADLTRTPGTTEWAATFAATLVTTVVGVVAIFLAISLSEGRLQRQEFPRALGLGVLVTVTNTSLALVGATVAWTNQRGVWLLVVPAATLFIAYRAYVSYREKNESLEFLHQSTRYMNASPQVESALRALLAQARTMFRAEEAEIVLLASSPGAHHDAALRTTLGPGDAFAAMQPGELPPEDQVTESVVADDVMIVPLRGETKLLGLMSLTNRLGDVTGFDDKDLTLFETLASHVSVWLENSRLERSLVQLTELQEQLRYQALHDPLTSLANRALFTDHVQHAVARGDRHDRQLAVLFLDLDDFKAVNDSLGHGAGDSLLVAVAERLRACLRPGDTAARFGGDEFAILLEDISAPADAVAAAERISEALRAPFFVQNRELRVGASIGVAVRTNENEASQLLRNSDVAMYIAKRRGKGRHELFEASMYAAAVERHELKEDLQRAAAQGDFVVHYQPIIDLETGKLNGVEALVRWDRSDRGLIAPSEFIPVAEDTGMILQIGRFVLEEACRQAGEWQRLLPEGAPLSVNVNLSARQLSQVGFVEEVAKVLSESELDPGSLVLEITETVLMEGDGTVRRLAELRDLGVRLAIDDFGTGYSSLSYLRRFPIDILKMDKTFVQGVGSTAGDDALARAIIDLTHTLGLVVVAEGIERREQAAELRRLQCNLGQGYYFTRPLEASAIEPLILNGSREPSPV
jgi:diguanylate cyclase (GGDEF)-like protein